MTGACGLAKVRGQGTDSTRTAFSLLTTTTRERAIADVMAANADKVAEYCGGKDKLFGFFVGQTMRATGGKANPGVVNDLLKKALAG